jgi:hypothetical protein
MDNIVQAIKELPEVKLRIIPLAWSLLDENGDLDMAKAAAELDGVKEACDEAEAYCKLTQKAVSCLRDLAHSQS